MAPKTALQIPVNAPQSSVAIAYHAARRAQLQAFLTAHLEQAQELHNSLRAKWLKRASEGDVDAVLYCLAQGW